MYITHHQQVGGEKDGVVTRNEFENYYSNLGASIDNEDYFELMIRNAWHISGGEGAAANSANKRVLVTHADGRQTVEEIQNDLGLRSDDKEGMMARLRAQGSTAESLSLHGSAGDATPDSQAYSRGYGGRPKTAPGQSSNNAYGIGATDVRPVAGAGRKKFFEKSNISFC
jgi:hypothetical protein